MQSVFCSVPYSEFIQNMKCVFDKQIWPFELFKNVMLIFLEQENTDISSTCRRHFFSFWYWHLYLDWAFLLWNAYNILKIINRSHLVFLHLSVKFLFLTSVLLSTRKEWVGTWMIMKILKNDRTVIQVKKVWSNFTSR